MSYIHPRECLLFATIREVWTFYSSISPLETPGTIAEAFSTETMTECSIYWSFFVWMDGLNWAFEKFLTGSVKKIFRDFGLTTKCDKKLSDTIAAWRNMNNLCGRSQVGAPLVFASIFFALSQTDYLQLIEIIECATKTFAKELFNECDKWSFQRCCLFAVHWLVIFACYWSANKKSSVLFQHSMSFCLILNGVRLSVHLSFGKKTKTKCAVQ